MRLLRFGLVGVLVGWIVRQAQRPSGTDDLWQRATAEADARAAEQARPR